MDKTGIIVVSICVLLLGWWFVDQNKVAQEQAHWRQTNELAKVQAQLVAAASASNAPAATKTANVIANTATTAIMPVFDSNTPEQTWTTVH